jgi:hypothetical protein
LWKEEARLDVVVWIVGILKVAMREGRKEEKGGLSLQSLYICSILVAVGLYLYANHPVMAVPESFSGVGEKQSQCLEGGL